MKSLRVRHSRVLMAAPAQTWSLVITALVRQLTSVAPVQLRTAATTTDAVTAVLVTALGCAAVYLDTQVILASQLMNHVHLFVFIKNY